MRKLSVVVLLCVLSIAGMAAGYSAFGNRDLDNPPPANAVGQVNPNGPPIIFLDRLVKTFVNGGNIAQFKIVNLSGNWKLLRQGVQGSNKRTEICNIFLEAGFFKIPPAIWYVVCDRGLNDCTDPGFCDPNTENTACVCANGGANCNFGGESGNLFPNQVLNP